jgi:guanylate kinase
MKPIAISGKMGTGKTTLLHILQANEPNFKRLSLADPVKEVAQNYFMMPKGEKDRWLLQQIGQKFRSIRQEVWVDLLNEKAKAMIQNQFIPICDDVRFPNELATLKENGWIVIRLKLSEEEQLNRIKRTYGGDWEQHWSNRYEESETALDDIGDEQYDFVFENTDIEGLNELASSIMNASFEQNKQ